MPSDALANNLGRLNNSIEKLFPLLNAVANGNKQDNDQKAGKQKLDKSIKAMSSGMFMSIIIDNVSSKEAVKATDSMKKMMDAAGNINTKSIDNFKVNVEKLVGTLNSISKEGLVSAGILSNYINSISFFIKSINELNSSNLTKSVKNISEGISELVKIDFSKAVSRLNSLDKISARTALGAKAFAGILLSLSTISNLNFNSLKKKIDQLNSITFGKFIRNLNAFEKLNDKTKKNVEGFVKIIDSLSEIEHINISKTTRKLKKLFKSLDFIKADLIKQGAKRIDSVKLSGLADFINAAKFVEEINTRKAKRKIKKLRNFFKSLTDIVRDVILAPDSPFANKAKIKDLKAAITAIKSFTTDSKLIIDAMAANALLGIPAILGMWFTKIVFTGLSKMLDKLSKVKNISKNTIESVKSLAFFALAMAGVTGILVLSAKMIQGVGIGAILGTIALLAFVTWGFIRVGKWAQKIKIGDINGVKNLGILALIMVGVTASIVLIAKLYENTDTGSIWSTLGLMVAVAVGLVLLGKISNKINTADLAGIGSLALIAGLMIGVTASIILIAKLYETTDPGSIWATLGLLAVTSATLVGIGLFASLVKIDSLLGIAAMGIMAVIMIGTTYAIVKLADDINKIGFGKMMAALGTMVIVATSLIGLGALLGYAQVVTGPAIIGAIALAAIAGSMAYAMNKVVEIYKVIKANKEVFEFKKINGKDELAIMSIVTPVIKGILELGDSIGETSYSSYIKTKRTIKLTERLLNTIEHMINMLSKFNKSGLTEEKAITAATGIGTSIKVFMEKTYDIMDEVSKTSNSTIRKTRKTLKNINRLLNLTDKFLNIIQKYSPEKNKGNDIIKIAENSASTISGALLTFVNTFFNGFGKGNEKQEELEIRTNRENKRIRKTLKNLEKLVGIVPSFLNSVKEYENMKSVDLSSSAQTIATTISTFLNTLYSENNISSWNKIGGRTGKKIGKLLNIIDPINNFIDMLSKIQSDGDSFKLYKGTDDKGNIIWGEPVNISNIATKLAESITKFLSSFYSESKKWDDLAGKNDVDGSYMPTNRDMRRAKRRLGKLLDILDPITTFTEIISKFSSNDSLNEIDPTTGAIKKSVKMSDVGRKIGEAISTFLKALYSQSDDWSNITGTSETSKAWQGIKELGKAAISGLRDINQNRRLGKFAEILDPINTFMALVSSYKWDGTSLTTPNGTIQLEETGKNIALGIKAFIKGIHSSQEDINTNTDVIIKLGDDFSEAFKKIDDTLEKSKNDKRIKELKKLSDEFSNLAKSIDKFTAASDSLPNKMSTSANEESKSNAKNDYSSNNNSNNSVNTVTKENTNFDLEKLSQSVETAINNGIKSAFKDQYKFTAVCQYNETLKELSFTKSASK